MRPKAKLCIYLASFLVGAMVLSAALWPASEPNLEEQAIPSLSRQTGGEPLELRGDWQSRATAVSLAKLPLYGRLLSFEVVPGFEGSVGIIQLSVPMGASTDRIWLAMLEDASLLVEQVFSHIPDLGLVWVICGMDFGLGCEDGCSDHLYNVFVTYVEKEAIQQVWPVRGAELINEFAWWDTGIFPGKGGR